MTAASSLPPPPVHAALQRAALALAEMRARLDVAEARDREPLALIGIGCRLPGCVEGPEDFWRLVLSGADATGEVPASRWDPAAAAADAGGDAAVPRRGGFLGPVDGFDAAFWGISPREAAGMDPQQRLLLECAWEALEDAGLDPLRLRGARVGVFVGICAGDYAQMVLAGGGLGAVDAYHASGTAHSTASGRLSYLLGLRGPSLSVDTACSSSLMAVHLAAQSLRAGECDLAIAGGVNLILAPTWSVGFGRAGMLAPDGRCKAFAAEADGYGRAEGCGVVVLRRLDEARAAGDRAWAVLRGSAAGQDGASGGLTVPNGPAQAEVIRTALARAGAVPDAVAYVEAHGTGTALGDPIEAGALASVFAPGRPADRPLLLGSAKASIGHAEAAAGVAGLIKAALSLRRGLAPPHPGAERPTPHVDWASGRLALPRAATPLPPDALVGVSAFGFSGTNVHAVLGPTPAGTGRDAPMEPAAVETAAMAGAAQRAGSWVRPGHSAAVGAAVGRAAAGSSDHAVPGTTAHAVEGSPAPPGTFPDTRPAAAAPGTTPARPGVLVLSARSRPALDALMRRMAARLDAMPGAEWPAACWTAATGRAAMLHRIAFAAEGPEEAARLLRKDHTSATDLAPGQRPRLLMLFTGQGGLQPGAGAGLLSAEPAFARAWAEACAAADPHLPSGGPGLHAALHGPEAAWLLARGAYAQPAQTALAAALLALWAARGIAPDVALGHSLGELAAAHAAGVLSLEGMMRLAAARGRICDDAIPPTGGMATTTAPAAAVLAAIARLPAPLATAAALAADHGPAGATVSGAAPAVAALAAVLEGDGHACQPLAAARAFHSPLVEPALDALARAAAQVPHAPPRIPLLSTATGAAIARGGGAAALDWPAHWARHMRGTVRFAEALRAATETETDGASPPLALELGPRPTLAPLARSIRPRLATATSLDPAAVPDALALARATAALWRHGVAPDWAATLPAPHRRTDLPLYPWDRRRHWAPASPGAAPALPQHHAHPLLGDRQPGVGPELRFLLRLDPVAQPVLAEHALNGTPVLPAAAMLVMAAEAARRLWPDRGLAVTGATFERPLPLTEPVAVQLLLRPEGEDGTRWEIHATAGLRAADPDAVWTRHAAGALRPTGSTAAACPEASSVAPDSDAAPSDVAPAILSATGAADFYAALERTGLRLDASFRGLRRLARGADGTTTAAEVAVPEEGTHAALAAMLRLDAAMQAAAAVAPDNALRIPAGVDRVLLRAPLPATFHVEARRRTTADAEEIRADLLLSNLDGRPLGTVECLRLRRAAPADPLAGLAYRITWREASPPPGPVTPAAGAPAPDAPALQDALDARLAALPGHAAHLAALEARAAAHAAAALVALGAPIEPGTRLPEAAALGVAPRHHRLFARMAEMLAEDGVLVPDGEDGGFRTVAWPAPPAVPMPGAEEGPEAALLESCAAALPAVLRGERDPLDLLFGGDAPAAARLHRESLWAAPFAAQLAECAAALLRDCGAAPRVLEVGAGTGGATAALLPMLPQDAEYLFTDIATSLLAAGSARFALPGFRAQRLDIERDPAEQGFAPGAQDLVVCANVLHATRDLRATLRHVRALLAPGGALALLECTAPLRWGDLTFGLTEGWWRFDDAPASSLVPLRTRHPMLPPDAWRRLLAEAGFESIGVVSGEATPWRQAVILARAATGPASTTASTAAASWLLLTDAGGLGDALADRLSPGARRLPAVAGETAIGAALAALLPGGGDTLAGVVHLGALDAVGASDPAAAAERTVCTPVLDLVRALSATAGRIVPVWLVTRGAVDTTDGADGPPDAAQAALWGLGRVLALEHPELRPRLLDTDGDVTALAAEIARGGDAEAQIALRAGRRLVARLVREPAAPPPPPPFMPTSLAAAGEVEIEVRAAGVNFRDVLIGLGAYPESRAAPGIECLGTVLAAPPEAAGPRPNDSVLAIVPSGGAYSSRVRAPAALVAPAPAGFDGAVAAALPVAYLTAAWALREVAGLRPGQRVLIHAAGTGTGLAALHLARTAGAEVVATASRRKHAFLRDTLGVPLVVDSRDPAALAAAGEVDVVLASLGRAAGLASLSCLTPGGCYVELGRVDALDAVEASRLRPDLRFHTVDLAREAAAAPERLGPVLRGILAELEAGLLPPLPVTRIGDAGRALRRMQAARHVGKLVVTRAPTEGTVLITGAFGGLGLAVARALIGRGVRHLVLARRHEAPPTALAEVEALRRAGAELRVVALDITDRAALARVLDEIDAGSAPLRGVVHAAGVVEDAPATRLGRDALARVLAPKLAGAWALHELTRDRGTPLDLFALFSSAAGTLGNPGQGAHAAANAALDALALHRRALGLPALSIAWGPWAGAGHSVTAEVERRLAARGLPGLGQAEGLAAFLAALDVGLPHLVVGRIAWDRFLAGRGPAAASDPFLAEAAAGEAAGTPMLPRGEAPPSATSAEGGGSRAALRHEVCVALAAVLGLPGAAAVDTHRGFFEQGMDSLTSLEFRNRLQAALGRPLLSSLAMDHPNVERLVAHLAGDDAAPAAAADLDAMDEDALSALLDARLERAEQRL
jgi:acyl transferase domain-containing protein/NADPH:quinone reductase-like Zn-dependent oxidoreductase/NAD(P)-dependent dehydrogenase (short-subunit alcohol dehydrogenase family)/SAM-dependent methyltransferase